MTDWMRNVVWGNREAPAVYADWTIDPATRIITNGPTGYAPVRHSLTAARQSP
jgi:hypothetical protein